MDEVVSLMEFVQKLGIPALFFVIVLVAMFKYYPDWRKEQKESRDTMQKSYDERNKVFSEQFTIVVKVAEQSNQIIARNNEIISQTNEIIKQNTVMHDKVISALGRDFEALSKVSDQLHESDRRAEGMNNTLIKLAERVEK